MLRIFSWNVNGLRAVLKKGALQDFMEAEKPDVLCLQETKAKQGQAEVDCLLRDGLVKGQGRFAASRKSLKDYHLVSRDVQVYIFQIVGFDSFENYYIRLIW